ncbi:hypothetical protein HAX54_043908 [Datura stramonium]|uniref:Uncharacterized protein n=1 Tax=Datura stramonium TaxID=4076 RepID=A0ABS8W3V5_DATST|nr:hypothetical protein [Datura stramonium]
MECSGSEKKCCNLFLVKECGESQSDNSKIQQGKCQENFDEVEYDAESSNYGTKDNLENSQEVTSGIEERDNELIISYSNDEEESDGHHCSRKEDITCKGFVEDEDEEDVSSSSISRAINVEDEVERNRLFWLTCFEVGYP